MLNDQVPRHISNEERVKIGLHYQKIPQWKLTLGMPLIYIPAITTMPFVLLNSILVRLHLYFFGAKNLRRYKDFIPKKDSFRYDLKSQISVDTSFYYLRSKILWFYSCGVYCPYSVALFNYNAYLIEVVENWWCPFDHDKKSTYTSAAIDNSYWHLDENRRKKLHKDDLNNPLWNSEK